MQCLKITIWVMAELMWCVCRQNCIRLKLKKTDITSRSSRKIKLPSRFEDSVTSSRGVKPTKQSSFDNFVKCGQAQDSKMSIERLRSDWNLMTDEEKLEFRTQTSAVDYRALDCGDLFFDSDE